jgi:gliding motility-associated-like protein
VKLCINDSILINGKFRFPQDSWSDSLVGFNQCDSVIHFKVERDSSSVCSCSNQKPWPNVFTPNGDNSNEYFPDDLTPNSKIEIFDRWGILIFRSKGIGWDGTFNGSEAPTGTYFYFIEYRDCHGFIVNVHGVLSLIR